MSGNTMLVNHGIQNENSDYRIHVGLEAGYAVFFTTAAGRAAMERCIADGMNPSPVYVNGVHTANGYKVPIAYIEKAVVKPLPAGWIFDFSYWRRLKEAKDTSGLGAIAVEISRRILCKLYGINVKEVTDADMQISGTDIICRGKKIQVKFDWLAGPKEDGGSGNVYLQTDECNPRGLH